MSAVQRRRRCFRDARKLRTGHLLSAISDTDAFADLRARTDTTKKENHMASTDKPERTSGGIVGKIAGRAKEAAGTVLNDEELSREGRLQQTQVDAEAEAKERAAEAQQLEAEAELKQEKAETKAERELLENELQEKAREETAEADRRNVESSAEQRSAEEIAAAEQQKASEQSEARKAEIQAEQDKAAEKRAAVRLVQEAQRAEAEADVADPKENS